MDSRYRSVFGVALAALLALHAAAAFAADAPLVPVQWDDPYQRWRDIATNPYDSAQKASYTYSEATVTLSYEATASTFTGTLTGSGLKPNFAYQLKLNGKPSYTPGDLDGDDWANEQLGYLGRWWLTVYDADGYWLWARNSSDTEYATWKAKNFVDPDTFDRYVFEGYLLFDYVVTDAKGKVSKALALDSSLHVLWKTSQRQPGAGDTDPTSHTVVANSKSDWYARKFRTKTIGIFGEGEPGRPAPGAAALPLGIYNIRIFLTEESFHEGAPDSGSWATVMANDYLSFAVDNSEPPSPPKVSIVSVAANDTQTGGNYDITATVENIGGSPGTVTLTCKVTSGKRPQNLAQKSVSVGPGQTVAVAWNDPVSRKTKAGFYTAQVTLVETGESAGDSFTIQ